MRPRSIRAALPALALLLALGATGPACGGGDSGPTRVTFWQFFPSETITPLIEKFEEQHPDIRVEMQQLTWASGLEKITAAVAAGNPPDLCELGSTWFAKFAANGTLVDWTTPSVNLRPEFLMWDACTYEDRVYGLPWMTGTRALFVNAELAERAGWTGPVETWDQLLALVRAIDGLGDDVYGYGMNAGERYIQFKKFMPYAWGNGGRVLTADLDGCAFDSDAVREALEFYLELEPSSLREKQEILDQAFQQGRLGAMISGAWLLKTLPKNAPDLRFDVHLVPRPPRPDGVHASFGGGEILVSFARSKESEAAFELARFLCESPQAMAITRAEQSVLPAAAAAATDPWFGENPHQAVFRKQLETAVFPPNIEAWVEIQDAVDTWLEKAVFGRVTPSEALRETCVGIDAVLEKAH